MSIDELIGYHTYRSFLNRPIGAPNDILWGEGELFLLDSGAQSESRRADDRAARGMSHG